MSTIDVDDALADANHTGAAAAQLVGDLPYDGFGVGKSVQAEAQDMLPQPDYEGDVMFGAERDPVRPRLWRTTAARAQVGNHSIW